MSQFDALAYLLALGSAKTATYHTAAYNLFNGNAQGKVIWAQFLYDTVVNVSGNNYIAFTADWSDDGTTWTTNTLESLLSQSETVLSLSTTAQYGEAWLPIYTVHQYIRCNIVISGGGSTPSGNFGIRLTADGGPRVP